MTPDILDSDEKTGLKFNLLLTIKHPIIQPSEITRELKLTPSNSWISGEERTTPAGRRLAGRNKFSLWVKAYTFTGQKHFFQYLTELVEHLESSGRFIRNIHESNGSVSIVVQLSGKRNIGSEIGWQELNRLASLRVTLGIEVFPDF